VNIKQRDAVIEAEAIHCVTYCRARNCDLRYYVKSLTDGAHWSPEHGSLVALRLVHLGYDLDSAGELVPVIDCDATELDDAGVEEYA